MADAPLNIKVILASTREGRNGEKVARWFYGIAEQHEGINAELVDLLDWPLPFFNAAKGPSSGTIAPEAERWAELIDAADGFVIVTPEYNHGYPAQLKNALDHLYHQWVRKPVAFVSYGGGAGGTRAAEQLRTVAIELQMAPIRATVALPMFSTLFDENGQVKAESLNDSARTLLNDLVWWGNALKAAREG